MKEFYVVIFILMFLGTMCSEQVLTKQATEKSLAIQKKILQLQEENQTVLTNIMSNIDMCKVNNQTKQ